VRDSMPRTLFICDKEEHPVHVGFAESIGADFSRYTIPDYIHGQNWTSRALDLCRGITLPDYDVYLASGLFIPVVKKILKKNKPKIILLAASSYYSRLTMGILKTIPRYEKSIIKQLFRFVARNRAILLGDTLIIKARKRFQAENTAKGII